MKKLAAVLLTILATNALAFQGRPVSDLRFEGRVAINGYRVASDGTDFLLLSRQYQWFQETTFIEKVVDGRTVGPHRYLGIGSPVALAWTGTQYLAAWGDHLSGVRIAALSRDGSVISMSETAVMQGESFAMAANATGALIFGLTGNKITVQPLGVTGSPVGIARTYDAPAFRAPMRAAPIVGGFGVIFSGYNTTALMLFRADGTTMTAAPVTIDGPYGGTTSDYHSTGAVIATDGTDNMVVFGVGIYNGPGELKTAVVGSNGTLKSVRVIHTLPATVPQGPVIAPSGLVWTGTRYIATVSVDKDPSYADTDVDPALVPIASNGELAGELTFVIEDEGKQIAPALGWNGRELLVPLYEPWPDDTSFHVTIDPSTMQQRPSVRLGRTLTTQSDLALQTGHDGYLAAWTEYSDGEVTVRASRVDAAGNYLDGEGVILNAIPSDRPPTLEFSSRTIAIDGSGPQWFVVWSDGEQVRGRSLSPQGSAGAAVLVGSGKDVAVRWNGAQYVVLRADSSLYSNTVSIDGVVGETNLLAEYENLSDGESIRYSEPLLTRLGGRMLAVYMKTHSTCYLGAPGSCDVQTAVIGRLLDDSGSSPFTIAENVLGDLSIAAAPTRAMVMWAQDQGLRGAFLPAEAPQSVGASFPIVSTPQPSHSSLGFDGNAFVGAWWLDLYETPRRLVTARITATGTVHDRREVHFSPRPFWAEPPPVAAAAGMRSVVGFVDQLPAHDGVPRAGLLFVDEIGDGHAAPPAPSITCAARRDDGSIRVSWAPIANVANVHGVAIDLQLPDGTFRNIGVAPSGATTATVSAAGLDGSAVRIRAWNGFGVSEPSAIAPSTVPLIDHQTVAVRVSRNQTATLSVVTATHGTGFAWYEGVRGDTAHPVGRNDATFITPPATRTTQYWVRLTTACGTIDSETMTVSVDTRRRAARK